MIKVDIISGFLGAGKTTLIKHLLAHVYAGENVVLIENEFGEIGIDGGFMKEAGIEIRVMNSGCICCSLVGDFATSLKEVVDRYTPDRILIEPSGVGKLSDVVKAVENVSEDLDLEICYKVAVIDVSKCKMYLKNFGEFYKNQIENAQTVIFSRTDIAKSGKVEEALALVKDINDAAAVITTPVTELEDEVLKNALNNTGTAKSLIAEEECCCGHHHDHDHDHEHHHHHEGECCCGHDMKSMSIMSMSTIITTMTTIIMTMTTIMSMNTIITTMTTIMNMNIIMRESVVVDMTIIMNITTIMQMKFLRAGEWKLQKLFRRLSLKRYLLSLRRRQREQSFVRRESYNLRKVTTGCTLIMFQVSLKSEKARKIVSVRCA